MSNESVVIKSMDINQLREMLQKSGYRSTDAEHNGAIQLLSGTQGIGFTLRLGNPAGEEGQVLDFVLSCALRVQGELPAALVYEWNSQKRFARLSPVNDFLVLEMDVVVAGGVSERYLQANMELWDRLVQDYVLFLRNFALKNSQVSAPELSTAEPEPTAADQLEDDAPLEQQA